MKEKNFANLKIATVFSSNNLIYSNTFKQYMKERSHTVVALVTLDLHFTIKSSLKGKNHTSVYFVIVVTQIKEI